MTFKYNVNAKYSTKDLRGGHNNNFSLLDVYLDEKSTTCENPVIHCPLDEIL